MISIAVVEPWRTITAAPLVLALPLGEVRLTCATGVGVPLAVELVPVEVAAVLEAGAVVEALAAVVVVCFLELPPLTSRITITTTAMIPSAPAPSRMAPPRRELGRSSLGLAGAGRWPPAAASAVGSAAAGAGSGAGGSGA